VSVRAFLFARGGSKGVPRKNLRVVGGKPLIAHSIETAIACPSLGRIVISTDDEEIASVALAHGADVPFIRPSELAADTAPEWLAWRHAIEWIERNEGPFDIFVSLPATSPFRAIEDVEACIAMLHNNPETDVVVTGRAAETSPYFNMVKLDDNGFASLVIPQAHGVARRQDAPTVFDMTAVAYAVRTAFIKQKPNLFSGKMRMLEVPAERALDIDTPYDLMIAECIARVRAGQ